MKSLSTALIAISFLLPSAARAEKPELVKLQFTTSITCDKVNGAPDSDGLVKIDCKPEDLKTYPFLADLTKDRTTEGSVYGFGIAKVEDKSLANPLLIVNMRNDMVYSSWGSAGAFVVNKNGSYTPTWHIGNGTAAYTASCPKELSYIIVGNEKTAFSKWVYTGTEVKHVAGFDKIDAAPDCGAEAK
jgi:hypothetical protein